MFYFDINNDDDDDDDDDYNNNNSNNDDNDELYLSLECIYRCGTNVIRYTTEIRSNHWLVFEERGKPFCLEKNLSEQSRGPTNSTYI